MYCCNCNFQQYDLRFVSGVYMPVLRRHKVVLTTLLVYWAGIFVLTHIPIPVLRLPSWVIRAQMSDKSMHFLAYLTLVFLWWSSISPYKKVNWHKATVWWALAVIVWYGAIDEWLQAYVGRTPDVNDFYADLAGTVAGLVLLSIFSFWSASLFITACIILTLTTFSRIPPGMLLPRLNAIFHLCAYAFFSVLWIQYIKRQLDLNAPDAKWLITTAALPLVLLLSEETSSYALGKGFFMQDMITGAIGVALATITFYIAGLCRSRVD